MVGAAAAEVAAADAAAGAPETMSPDGTKGAFIRDWNLWVRDVATGQETQLTTDGVKDFGYATDNAGWTTAIARFSLWSPDSKKIATQQQDERNVGDMYLVETKVGHPVLRAWKYPLPGDSVVAMIHRVIIDVRRGAANGPRSRCRPTTTAPRSATTSRAAAARGPTSTGSRRLAARVRVDVARPQARGAARRRRGDRRGARRVRGDGRRRNTSRATDA